MSGQEVDGYRILEEIGRGGMGVVYKATNLSLDRVEALKFISPHLVSNGQLLRRFRREAKVLARIHHPHIVTIYTLQQSDSGLYITMELVEGDTLADLVARRGPLHWRQALPIVRQLLDALDYAHKRGIIHRDIKPQNIMVDAGGRVKMMDFGLAKFFLQGDVTQTQGVMGTPYYMSPEQVQGLKHVDQRSDIYSLGMTLYEVLSGRLPFEKEQSLFSIQRSILEDEFPTAHHINPDVPARLSQIIMKTLAKEPEDRYRNAGEMLDAIAAFENGSREPAADDTVALPRNAGPRESDPALHTIPLPDAVRTGKTEAPDETTLPLRKILLFSALFMLCAGLIWTGIELGPSLVSGGGAPASLSSGTGDTQDFDGSERPDDQANDATAADQAAALQTAEADGPPPPASVSTPQTQGTLDHTNLQRPANPETSGGSAGRRSDGAATDRTTDGEPEPAAGDETQPADSQAGAPSSETEAPAAPTVSDEEPPPVAPGFSAAELVRREALNLTDRLKRAVPDDAWSSLPGPVVEYYRNKLKPLRRRFIIREVAVIIDEAGMETMPPEVTLPVDIYVTVQQKGREGTEAFPIKSAWTWNETDDGVTLVHVADR